MKPSPAKVALLHVAGENEPTKPDLWAKVQALAKGEQKSIKVDGKTIKGPNDGKGFTVFPSAYANGWASKTYGDLGGGWKKKARGKAKKDVGHGGLDEWFSGHGGSKGKGEDATWGDWVSISPVTKTLDSGKKVEKGDIVGPCGISDDPDWKEMTKGGEDPLKCMPRQKAYDMPKKERAEKAKAKQKAEKADSSRGKKPTNTPTFKKDKKDKKSASIIAARYAAKKYEGIDFKPPKGVAAEAEKGLEYRRKSGKGGLSSQDAGKEGIGSGVQRAVNLKNRNNIAPDTIQQMLNFFSRHKKNKAISAENRDTPWEDAGYVAWLLWGGDAGLAWATKVKKQMDAADAKAKKSAAARHAGGARVLYHVGKRPAQPQPKRAEWRSRGQDTPDWVRPWLDAPVSKGVFLTPNPFLVAPKHGVFGNVYAYRVPQWVIKEAKGINRKDGASEVLIPEPLWKHVKFMGKSMGRKDFLDKVYQSDDAAFTGSRSTNYRSKLDWEAARMAALSDAARCAPGGMCFRYAANWDLKGPGSSPDDLVVHGYVEGLSGPHAWVERRDGRVFDWQTTEGVWETIKRQPDPSYSKKGWPKREFYAEFKPHRMKKYRAEDAMINAVRSRKHGPWTEAEEYFKPISKNA